jgi:hypothetical protein
MKKSKDVEVLIYEAPFVSIYPAGIFQQAVPGKVKVKLDGDGDPVLCFLPYHTSTPPPPHLLCTNDFSPSPLRDVSLSLSHFSLTLLSFSEHSVVYWDLQIPFREQNRRREEERREEKPRSQKARRPQSREREREEEWELLGDLLWSRKC